jgi:hypothetical protein
MPKLHKYRNREACYVLTSIRGAVVTFQLTSEGERKLIAAGIADGQTFPRALLLDLYRTGDAFTHGSGVDDPAVATAGQLELDFPSDPDPESAFPACDVCRSVNDLHLTLTGGPQEFIAQLQCATCREVATSKADTSIPIGLLSRPILYRLFQIKDVRNKAKNVKQFEDLLQAEFQSKWEALRKHRSISQTTLFDSKSSGELSLG